MFFFFCTIFKELGNSHRKVKKKRSDLTKHFLPEFGKSVQLSRLGYKHGLLGGDDGFSLRCLFIVDENRQVLEMLEMFDIFRIP